MANGFYYYYIHIIIEPEHKGRWFYSEICLKVILIKHCVFSVQCAYSSHENQLTIQILIKHEKE